MNIHAPDQFAEARQFLARTLPWPQGEESYIDIIWTEKSTKNDEPQQPEQSDSAKKKKEKLFWNGRAVRTLDSAIYWVQAALKNDNTQAIYACMSSQLMAEEKLSKKGNKYLSAIRNQSNAVALRSFFVDLDYKGQDKNSYNTVGGALAALAKVIKSTNLPKPTMMISTGGGLHVHWVISSALPPNEWLVWASALVNAAKQHGLKFDSQCTTDSARVLRIPKTLNKKYDGDPRPVQFAGTPLEFDYTLERITKALEPYKVAVPNAKAPRPSSEILFDPALFPPKEPIKVGQDNLGAGITSKTSQTDLRAILDATPNTANIGWKEWNDVGMRCWAASEGEDYGLEEWQRWSDRHPTANGNETGCTARWEAFHHSPPTRTGVGALIKRATQVAPQLVSASPPTVIPASYEGDPLDFIKALADEAVQRINNEYFFRRDTSEICRQDAATGEIQVLTQQQFKTALAGRWVFEAPDPKTGKTKVRDAATVWLESRARREVRSGSGILHRAISGISA
jgi:hypothetical protein